MIVGLRLVFFGLSGHALDGFIGCEGAWLWKNVAEKEVRFMIFCMCKAWVFADFGCFFALHFAPASLFLAWENRFHRCVLGF